MLLKFFEALLLRKKMSKELMLFIVSQIYCYFRLRLSKPGHLSLEVTGIAPSNKNLIPNFRKSEKETSDFKTIIVCKVKADPHVIF